MISFKMQSPALLATAGAVLAVLYLVHVASRRFERVRKLEAKYGSRYAVDEASETREKPRMIHAGLKGVRDAQRIVRSFSDYDFPFMAFTALEFGLSKTFGIPTISSLLVKTGQLSRPENVDRRFVDTSVLIAAFGNYPLPRFDLEGEDTPEEGDELIAQDPDDPRSAIALARMNYLHRRGKSKISNDDLLYTLSLFMFEQTRFIDRYEWRALTELEKEAAFTTFYHIGRCMGIENIPDTRERMLEWSTAYEAEHMVYADTNRELAESSVNLLLTPVPRPLRSLARPFVVSLLDPRLREAFGYKPVPRWVEAVTHGLLRARGVFVRFFLPPRRLPYAYCPADIQDLIIAGAAAGGICPASGISAAQASAEGKACTSGDHMAANDESGGASKEADVDADDVTVLPRLQPAWVEYTPWYTGPAKAGSLAWIWERLFVRNADRRGAPRWQSKILADPTAKSGSGTKAIGFRLEECGPAGLELVGREEVLKEATKLHGKPLTGPWAFKPKAMQHPSTAK